MSSTINIIVKIIQMEIHQPHRNKIGAIYSRHKNLLQFQEFSILNSKLLKLFLQFFFHISNFLQHFHHR